MLHKIRPAARLITSIGEGLIKDVPAAIVELVKNSYDADASYVEIIFSVVPEKNGNDNSLSITIKDNGHGMSFDTVVNKWMVPATNDKLIRKKSLLKKRTMQGRKGIGRYASAILGNELILKTTDLSGNITKAIIDWEEFEKKQFLTDVEILINQITTEKEPEIINSLKCQYQKPIEDILYDIDDQEILNKILKSTKSGTQLEIKGNNEKLSEWTDSSISILISDLKKLLSPMRKNTENNEDFRILLEFQGFSSEKYSNFKDEIKPFPVIDLYDYRIHGTVDENGKTNLFYENNTGKKIIEEIKTFSIFFENDEKYCGPIEFDFRVFDKDPESIENLLQKKGLRDNVTGRTLGKNEAKALIREISGVGIYRGAFRIRPYGDKGYDWLELDKERVQNPSKRVGNDQIVGFINIAPEEISHLEEKSARDGLKETPYFDGLYEISKRVLLELENRRFLFRKKTGKGRKFTQVQEQLNLLFDFDQLTDKIENKLHSLNVKSEDIVEFKNIIKKSEEDKSELFKEIQETIATYQGQATLGKIIMVIQHEGRRPIGYIRNAVPVIESWGNKLKQSNFQDSDTLDKIVEKLNSTKGEVELISTIFSKIDPLSQKRKRRKTYPILRAINKVGLIFEYELKIENVKLCINCDDSLETFGWEEDLVIALTNLVENSIYWLKHSPQINEKILRIDVFKDQKDIIIDVIDNGIGIDPSLIEENIIFEPSFTTKTNGMGLGLAIAGEAITRNEGQLKALSNDQGAHFRIELKGNRDVLE